MKIEKISDLMLEQALLKELPGKEYELIMQAIEQSPDLKARFEALKESNQEFISQYPTYQFMANISLQKKETLPKNFFDRKVFRRISFGMISLLILFTLLIFNPFSSHWQIGVGPDTTREKGLEPFLTIYRQKSTKDVEQLKDKTLVKAGDLLQIGMIANNQKYGAVFSIDGRGAVTLHFPRETADSTLLPEIKKELILPHAYELDDAPRFEKFYFITANLKLELKMLKDLADKLAEAIKANPEARLILPAYFKLFTLTLLKEGNNENY